MAEQGSSGVMRDGKVVTLADHAGAEAGNGLVREYLSAMRVLGLEEDDRCVMLRHCQSFYDGTQHDHTGMDWNGIPRDPGVGYLHERLKPQGFVPVNSSQYAARKPDAPVPLARQVVSRFTEMLLGEGRCPSIRVPSDPASEEYLEAVFKCADLWDVLAEARDVAGACGTAAVAVGITAGWINAEVLHPRNLWVAEWDNDDPGWAPRVVVEQYKATVQVLDDGDDGNGRLKSVDVWRTRAWTPEEVVYYEDVPCGDVPDDGIPERERKPHKFGACPVVWYQNTRVTACPDGKPDCEGTWPLLDKLDRLQSQVYKAAIANTDPTLVIKEPRHSRRRNSIIQKGSTGAIPLPPEGSAEYLEMQGTSVKVGLEGINALVSEVLQTVECVVISPEYAKAYQSGEALQILWRSMESRANRLRVTLGTAIQRLCWLILEVGTAHKVANVEVVDLSNPENYRGQILLPPRRVVEEPEPPDPPEPGEPPPPKPEPVVTWEPHDPGNAQAHVVLDWPPYWTPTAQQILASAQAMATATTAKQIISAETATRHLAQMMGHDGDEEVRLLEAEKDSGMAKMMAMGATLNGVPDDVDDDEDEDDGDGDGDGDDEPRPPQNPANAAQADGDGDGDA